MFNSGGYKELKQISVEQLQHILWKAEEFMTVPINDAPTDNQKSQIPCLYNKYIIQKSDGTPVDPNAQYFVLRPDKDPLARKAIRAYARGLTAPEDQTFKQQLLDWIDQLSFKALGMDDLVKSEKEE